MEDSAQACFDLVKRIAKLAKFDSLLDTQPAETAASRLSAGIVLLTSEANCITINSRQILSTWLHSLALNLLCSSADRGATRMQRKWDAARSRSR